MQIIFGNSTGIFWKFWPLPFIEISTPSMRNTGFHKNIAFGWLIFYVEIEI